jgi:hypothetical protein
MLLNASCADPYGFAFHRAEGHPRFPRDLLVRQAAEKSHQDQRALRLRQRVDRTPHGGAFQSRERFFVGEVFEAKRFREFAFQANRSRAHHINGAVARDACDPATQIPAPKGERVGPNFGKNFLGEILSDGRALQHAYGNSINETRRCCPSYNSSNAPKSPSAIRRISTWLSVMAAAIRQRESLPLRFLSKFPEIGIARNSGRRNQRLYWASWIERAAGSNLLRFVDLDRHEPAPPRCRSCGSPRSHDPFLPKEAQARGVPVDIDGAKPGLHYRVGDQSSRSRDRSPGLRIGDSRHAVTSPLALGAE